MPHLLWILLLAFLISCSPRSEVPIHSFRVYEENSVTIAETRGGPKYKGELFNYEKVLEIEADPGVEESLLLDPSSMTRDIEGNLYVVDNGDMSIAMFDSHGNYLRRFGREGHGPGEFRSIGSPRVYNRILGVYDRWQDRVTTFDLSGALLDVTAIPSGTRSGTASTTVEDVVLISESRKTVIQRHIGMVEEMDRMGFTALILGSEKDSLWSVSTPMMKTSYTVTSGTSVMVVWIPYGIMPCITCSPSWGIYVSEGDKSVLDRYTLTGVKDLQIRIELDQEPVSQEEKAAIHRRMDQMIAESEGRPREKSLRDQRNALIIADQKPFWTTVLVDDAGFIWLEMSEQPEQRREAGGSHFRVLNPEGEYLGDSRWPASIYDASLSHGYLLCLETDEETGAHIPIVYRIEQAVSGLLYP